MKALEIKRFLDGQGITPMRFLIVDEEYSLPSLDYLNGAFSEDFRDYLKAWGLLEYNPERNDCDNFALNAMVCASNVHARTTGRQTGVAFGFFAYDSPQGPHAINFAVVEGPQLVFLEPQNAVTNQPLQVRLSQSEIESCFGYTLLG